MDPSPVPLRYSGERPPGAMQGAEPFSSTAQPGPVAGTGPLRTALTPAELVWMEDLREHLRLPGGNAPSLTELEDRFQEYCPSWHGLPPELRWNPTTLLGALGVCLGDALVLRYPDARWCALERDATRYPAVRLDSQRSTVLPLAAVSKRWLAASQPWMERWVERLATTAVIE